MFDFEDGEFTLGPYENIELSFLVTDQSISSSNVNVSIWPVHHAYALKELGFDVIADNSLLGDINLDGVINVLDVVSLVNIVLEQENNGLADLNQDGDVNVIDVVILVNMILGL